MRERYNSRRRVLFTFRRSTMSRPPPAILMLRAQHSAPPDGRTKTTTQVGILVATWLGDWEHGVAHEARLMARCGRLNCEHSRYWGKGVYFLFVISHIMSPTRRMPSAGPPGAVPSTTTCRWAFFTTFTPTPQCTSAMLSSSNDLSVLLGSGLPAESSAAESLPRDRCAESAKGFQAR